MIILLYGLLGFVFLVFVHELGHFLVALAFGIKVEEFAIGMGPTLFQKKYKGTMYKLCAIPLGGYCAIKGQSDFGSSDRNKDKDSFFGKSPWVRFCVVGAGPLFSFALGYILVTSGIFINGENRLKYTVIDPPRTSQLFKAGDKILSINNEKVDYWDQIQTILLKNLGSENTILLERNGQRITVPHYVFSPSEKKLQESEFFSYYKSGPVIVVSAVKDSPADKMGLVFGDIIVKVNGKNVRTDRDLNFIINESTENIDLLVHRYKNIKELAQKDTEFFNNKIYPFETIAMHITPILRQEKKVIGINLHVIENKDTLDKWEHTDLSLHRALTIGWEKSRDMVSINAKAILQLFKGNKDIRDSLSGPVKIFYEVGKLSQAHGFIMFLSFVGTISLALAFFNLLPFPALDGGHMLIAVIESVIRRPINAKILNTIQFIGIACLLTMFVYVTIKDIIGLF